VVNNPAPDPAPAPEPSPAPEPAPEPAPADAPLAGDKIVEAMKASIAAGEIKEFTMEQVKEWEAGEEEEVDGVTYQTGIASYMADTIFGPKPVQAKALIKESKVMKWIYSKTGMEIR
jgi:hypothetical protein